jgi:hypothetical protein
VAAKRRDWRPVLQYAHTELPKHILFQAVPYSLAERKNKTPNAIRVVGPLDTLRSKRCVSSNAVQLVLSQSPTKLGNNRINKLQQ